MQDPAAHMPQLNNNQYATLAGKEDDEDNATKSIGVEKDVKITGFRHYEKITGVDSDKKSTELGSTGATDKVYEMVLIEDYTAEADQDIAEGTDLLAGTETETEDVRIENVINPDLQVPTVEQTYNLRQRRNPRPDYTNRYGLQATIINFSLKKMSMKRGLKKFKQKGKK